MKLAEFIACDLETTGLSPLRGHRVIEIGAVRVKNGALIQKFHSLIDCGRSITVCARKIHGISDAMLAGLPKPREAFTAFREFIGQVPLAAHNAPFERSFLQHEFSHLCWSLTNRFLCRAHIAAIPLPSATLRLESGWVWTLPGRRVKLPDSTI